MDDKDKRAEASAAAMREALEHARCALAHVTPSGHEGDEDSGQCYEDCALCDVQSASAHLDAALDGDAGAAMLERVRRAEAALEATRKKLMDAWKALQESEKDRIATRVRLKDLAQEMEQAWMSSEKPQPEK